jgi:uncharacterized membrane protein
VLISQKRQATTAQRRSDIAYEVSSKARLEIAGLQRKLDRLHMVLRRASSASNGGRDRAAAVRRALRLRLTSASESPPH